MMMEALIFANLFGPVVQLVRMLACHARGRGFEPLPGRHFFWVEDQAIDFQP